MAARPDYLEALDLALDGVTTVPGSERVALDTAERRVLAQPIVADRDLPPFNRAQMDGYALRGAEVGRIEAWPVVGSIAAGQPADVEVPAERCVAIATGAPLPDDVDTVVQHELSDRNDPVRFTIDTIATGHAVHTRGADARAGDTLAPEGTVLGPHHLGIAATVGRDTLEVRARPRAAVLTSGDEIVGVADAVATHQIRNSNGTMTDHLLTRMGAQVISREHVVDDRGKTIDAVRAALERVDLLVTVGGISAGQRDYFAAAFEETGVVTRLHGAKIQPGGPIFIGRAAGGAMVVGLPGNPVSVLACSCLFAWPLLRALAGASPDLPWRATTLASSVRPNPNRRAYRPCMATECGVTVPTWAGSGDLSHTALTDGLVELPIQETAVEAGTRVRFLGWP